MKFSKNTITFFLLNFLQVTYALPINLIVKNNFNEGGCNEGARISISNGTNIYDSFLPCSTNGLCEDTPIKSFNLDNDQEIIFNLNSFKHPANLIIGKSCKNQIINAISNSPNYIYIRILNRTIYCTSD